MGPPPVLPIAGGAAPGVGPTTQQCEDAIPWSSSVRLPIRWTRLVTISATCAVSSSVRLSGAPSGMISAAPVQLEAIVGGAKAEPLAHAMGNTLSASNALFETYMPVNVATLRDVMEARRAGRRKLRA
jgi:hypothetical protein